MANKESYGWWMSSEKQMVDQCLHELLNGSSLIIQPLVGVDSETFCELVANKLWSSGYSDNAYHIIWSDLLDLSPSGVIGQSLYVSGGQLRRAEDLFRLDIDVEKPVLLLFSGVKTAVGQVWSELISDWANYLYQFKPYNESGQGLRCLLFVDAGADGLGRQSTVPEPFHFLSWPEPEESTVENFVYNNVEDFCNYLPPVLKQYVVYQILDLGGNRRIDLVELMKLVGDLPLNQQQETVDIIEWPSDNSWVKQAINSLQNIDKQQLIAFLQRYFNQGGFITPPTEFHPYDHEILDRLWEQGLYTPPLGDKSFGFLTPRAILALRLLTEVDSDFRSLKYLIPSPWSDRAAREVLDRCQQIERMLKQRAIQMLHSSPNMRKDLAMIFDRPSTGNIQKTNRQELLQSARWQVIGEETDDISLLQTCSLGSFFYFIESIGMEQHGNRSEHKRFVEIRNKLAHAERSNWNLYKSFVDIEGKLIGVNGKI